MGAEENRRHGTQQAAGRCPEPVKYGGRGIKFLPGKKRFEAVLSGTGDECLASTQKAAPDDPEGGEDRHIPQSTCAGITSHGDGTRGQMMFQEEGGGQAMSYDAV